MDPCPFVRVLVGNLALKMPVAPRPAGAGAGVHPSTSPCYCKIRLNKLPYQTASAPLLPSDPSAANAATNSGTFAAAFHLSKSDLDRISKKNSIFAASKNSKSTSTASSSPTSSSTRRPAKLKIAIYSGRRGTTCGLNSGRLLGKITILLDLKGAENKAVLLHNGWVGVGKQSKSATTGVDAVAGHVQLNLTVRAEPDPRFVFEFDGEPECCPQVLQVQGSMKQAMFTCKFSCRNPSDLHLRSRSMQSEPGSAHSWMPAFGSERERPGKERKGWSVTVHDLSGAPVALASMVTPFVASAGSDRVSQSNPGAWLILRPGDGTWKPWGRLECWRQRGGGAGSADGLGYRFELLPDHTSIGVGVSVAESALSITKGGKFAIDLTATQPMRSGSPGCSPRGSGDFGSGLWQFGSYRGFVMSATVEGDGKCSRPVVEVGVQHVGCAEDAAAFVALAAAVDLSVDACKLFSQKLRKELLQTDLLR